jgi:uncharacterized phage protein (TIGR01671 family)
MKQIKFRAWNAEENNMIFTFDGNYKIMVNSEDGTVFCGGHMSNGDWTEPVLMQFTGLLDKNGNEIYEGDILCDDEYHTWAWRGVVKFSHGVFGAEWLANVKSQSMVGSWGQKHNLRKLDDDILERQVIVGNIYENPELLSEPS